MKPRLQVCRERHLGARRDLPALRRCWRSHMTCRTLEVSPLVDREAGIMTDEHSGSRWMNYRFISHGTASHGRASYIDLRRDRAEY